MHSCTGIFSWEDLTFCVQYIQSTRSGAEELRYESDTKVVQKDRQYGEKTGGKKGKIQEDLMEERNNKKKGRSKEFRNYYHPHTPHNTRGKRETL